MLGHFAESDRYVTEVAELRTLTDDPALPFVVAMHEVMRTRMQRRDSEMLAAIARLEPSMAAMSQGSVMAAITLAGCAARAGDVEATRAQLAVVGTRVWANAVDPTPTSLLAEAFARAGTDDDRRRIRAILAQSPVREVCGRHFSFLYEGTVLRLLGLLDAALGDRGRAEQELREAHALATDSTQTPLAAQIAYELGGVLQASGKADEARRWTAEAARIARELGMTSLEVDAGAAASPAVSPQTTPGVRIVRNDAGWTVARGPSAVTVKDSRGMQLLARLVERPDEEIHVLALASGDETTSVPESTAGEVLDERRGGPIASASRSSRRPSRRPRGARTRLAPRSSSERRKRSSPSWRGPSASAAGRGRRDRPRSGRASTSSGGSGTPSRASPTSTRTSVDSSNRRYVPVLSAVFACAEGARRADGTGCSMARHALGSWKPSSASSSPSRSSP